MTPYPLAGLKGRGLRPMLLLAMAAVVGGSLLIGAQGRPAAGDWAAYGATNAGTKYSPLDQINKETVKNLRIAWRQSAIPMAVRQGRTDIRVPNAFQHTPLMVNGLLYMSTALAGAVAALDPATGEVVWFDPPSKAASGPGARGLAYWTDGKDER